MAPHVFALTPLTLTKHYPNLPPWAADAFHEIKYSGKQACSHFASTRLSPNARALINVALMPIKGYIYSHSKKNFTKILEHDVDPGTLFETKEDYERVKEHVDLCRLSRVVAKKWRFEEEREEEEKEEEEGREKKV